MSGMRRKHVIKQRPVNRPGVLTAVRNMAGKAHQHACTTEGCVARFDCSCESPEHNGACPEHRGSPKPSWAHYREPKACCVANTEHVSSPEVIAAHQLAGPGPWFRCRSCARTFGHPITEENA